MLKATLIFKQVSCPIWRMVFYNGHKLIFGVLFSSESEPVRPRFCFYDLNILIYLFNAVPVNFKIIAYDYKTIMLLQQKIRIFGFTKSICKSGIR